MRLAAPVLLSVPLVLAGCAAPIHSHPAHFVVLGSSERLREIEVTAAPTIHLSTGYTRHLMPGSRWEHVGTLPEGNVYRAVNSVFTIEGRDVHEAYLVLRDNRLLGFYLPGEARYSALQQPLNITIGGKP